MGKNIFLGNFVLKKKEKAFLGNFVWGKYNLGGEKYIFLGNFVWKQRKSIFLGNFVCGRGSKKAAVAFDM